MISSCIWEIVMALSASRLPPLRIRSRTKSSPSKRNFNWNLFRVRSAVLAMLVALVVAVVSFIQQGAPLHNLALYRPILPISKPGTTGANSKSRTRINLNGLKFQYHWNSPGSPFGEPCENIRRLSKKGAVAFHRHLHRPAGEYGCAIKY